MDANGRVYYIDHIRRITQWERPTASSGTGPGLNRQGSVGSATDGRHQAGAGGSLMDGQATTPVDDAESLRAVEMFNRRRQISVEDTISHASSVDDLTAANGAAETNAQGRHVPNSQVSWCASRLTTELFSATTIR